MKYIIKLFQMQYMCESQENVILNMDYNNLTMIAVNFVSKVVSIVFS